VDESKVEKNSTVEKVKSIATSKFINYKRKFVDPTKIPFYGKMLMATNNERNFIRIDTEEIRFWIRKISLPKHENHNIESDLFKEIPAFLYFLSSQAKIDFTKSRMVFTAAEIGNEQLTDVKIESKSGLFKEITEYFSNFFDSNQDVKAIEFTIKDIKDAFFYNNNQISMNYIRKTLKDDFKYVIADKPSRYTPFTSTDSRVGRTIIIDRNLAQIEKIITDLDDMPF